MRRLLALTATVVLLASCGEADPPAPAGPSIDVSVRSSRDGYKVVVVDGIKCIEYQDNPDSSYAVYGISCDWGQE